MNRDAEKIFELAPKQIKSIDLSNCNLTEFPNKIFEFSKIEKIDLRNNKISEIPNSILGLKKLKELLLEGNPILNIPPEILNIGMESIKNYLNVLSTYEEIQVFEAKVIIVGAGGVGKTSLVNRLVNDSYPQDVNLTEGINVFYWKLVNNRGKGNETININIWDFGGQEIYHETHQFFLSKKSLYIFVWQARSDDDLINFDYWLNIISLLGDNSPIIIVQNKIDERDKKIDENSLKEKFPNIVGFHNTSVRNGQGIRELREFIIDKIHDLPLFGYSLPKNWKTIRDHIEHLKIDFISYDTYLQICLDHNISSDQAISLSNLLQDSGQLIHYANDPILREIVILNPVWLTNVIYKVLDSRKAIENNGILEIGEIKKLWHKYDTGLHKYFFSLLQKFDLLILIDIDKCIIPQLLTLIEPQFEWDYKNNVRFEYHYDFMPSGIIQKVIIKMYEYVDGNVIWKNGGVFKLKNAKALIISKPFERKIQIFISGEPSFELLSIIKKNLEYINSTFNNLHIRILVPCICENCLKTSYPYMYELSVLQKFLDKGKSEIFCANGYITVSIQELLRSFNFYRLEDKNNVEIKKEEEPFAFEWDDENNLNLEYHHNFSNIEVLERFKDRLSNIIEQERKWSDGMILYRENNRALIENDILKNILKVSIHGNDNLEFLSVLRYEFEHVYKNYFTDKYKELIKCTCKECQEETDPYYFDFSFLRRRKNKGKIFVTCPKSAEDVQLNELLGLCSQGIADTSGHNTTIEKVFINNSDRIQIGDTNKSIKNMKNKKIINKGGQNIFADRIEGSTFNYKVAENKLQKLIKQHSQSKNEEEELINDLNVFEDQNIPVERKLTAKEKIETFLYKHSATIGESLVASALYDLGKMYFLGTT